MAQAPAKDSLAGPTARFAPCAIGGEIDHSRRTGIAVNLDDRPPLSRWDGNGRELFGGAFGVIGAEDNIPIRRVDDQFVGHATQ